MSDTSVSRDQLRSIVERIEQGEQERKEAAEFVRDIYAEAKANGFDVKALRKIVKVRAMDPDQRSEEEAMFDLYAGVLGMQISMEFGEAA